MNVQVLRSEFWGPRCAWSRGASRRVFLPGPSPREVCELGSPASGWGEEAVRVQLLRGSRRLVPGKAEARRGAGEWSLELESPGPGRIPSLDGSQAGNLPLDCPCERRRPPWRSDEAGV